MTTHAETCFVCGAPMSLVREYEQMQMGSRSAKVEVERFRCDSCGEMFVTPDQMNRAQRTLASHLRRQEGLLEPGQIQQIREKYGLTQAELEALLGVGPKTVVRWERGTVFQNKATDQLLRLIDAVPAAFEFLAREQGARLGVDACAVPQAPTLTVRVAIPTPAKTEPKFERVARIADFQREWSIRKPAPRGAVEIPDIPKENMR